MEKVGFKRFLEKGGIQKNPSLLVGLCFYWLIIFSALIMVFNTLELEVAARLIQRGLIYIPKIMVALVLLALGIFLSQFIRRFVQTSSRLANLPFPEVLGNFARYAIIGLAIIMALEYLDVSTTIIVESFIIIFIVLPLALCLVLIVGGRQIISNILAGRLLINEYKKGETIEFDSIAGQILSIDLLTSKIKSREAEVIVPNSELTGKIVKRIKAGGSKHEMLG